MKKIVLEIIILSEKTFPTNFSMFLPFMKRKMNNANKFKQNRFIFLLLDFKYLIWDFLFV